MNGLEFFVNAFFDALDASLGVAPYYLPLFAALFFGKTWAHYVSSLFLSNLEMIVLEVRLPKEIFKSPRAMEIAVGVFHQASPTFSFKLSDLYNFYWEGKSRPVSSLEIVSLGGKLKFYLHIRKNLKNVVESQIYAQYPEVEIHEAEDYTPKVPYGAENSNWDLWGTEYKLSKEDPYPIKTYIDYGLDKDPKEEYKTDPLTSILEFMGSIGPAEQVWFQIMVMATTERFQKPKSWFGRQDWKEEGKALVEKLMKRDIFKDLAPGQVINIGETVLSPGERVVVEAVERNISKIGFDCGMRALYLAPKDKFNPTNIGGLINLLKSFGTLNLNGFRITRYVGAGLELPWQDPFGIRKIKQKRGIFEAYCKRGWFFPPYDRRPFVLNSEELATVYHFPGQTAETPTLGRIEAKRGEAPVNLPV